MCSNTWGFGRPYDNNNKKKIFTKNVPQLEVGTSKMNFPVIGGGISTRRTLHAHVNKPVGIKKVI